VPFLPPNQQCQSTEIICTVLLLHKYYEHLIAASFQQLVEHFCSKNDIHQFTQQNKCENRSRGQLLTDVFWSHFGRRGKGGCLCSGLGRVMLSGFVLLRLRLQRGDDFDCTLPLDLLDVAS